MTAVPHIPALRRGRPYESLDQLEVKDYRTSEVRAKISHVNAGIIRKDLARIAESRAALKALPIARLLEICAGAGKQILTGTLPLGENHTQSADDYIKTLSSTSGLPHVMVRRNMAKINDALTNMATILKGLTRGFDPSILDRGFGEQAGTPVSFYPTTEALGLVMPSNSPAVNSLWLPAIALKIPVVIKPGRDEPWTPWRMIQAFIAAGCPAEAFGFYPTDHEGAGEILKGCGRALLFGDAEHNASNTPTIPRIEIHGPGYSKILIGEDKVDNWREYLDVIAASIADNGGRSCINASTVVVPRHGNEIARSARGAIGKARACRTRR